MFRSQKTRKKNKIEKHVSKWWIIMTYLFGVLFLTVVGGVALVIINPMVINSVGGYTGGNIVNEVDAFCLDKVFGEKNMVEKGDEVFRRFSGPAFGEITLYYDSNCPECLTPRSETEIRKTITYLEPTSTFNKIDVASQNIPFTTAPYLKLPPKNQNSKLYQTFESMVETAGNENYLNTNAIINDPRSVLAKVNIQDSFSIGSLNAPVTVIVFMDFDGPDSREFLQESWKNIVEKYINTNKVRFIIKNNPLDVHENSFQYAKAMECAGDQGKYFEFMEKLVIDNLNISESVRKVEMGTTEADICLGSKRFDPKILADMNLAKRLGITEMPAFIINNKLYSGYSFAIQSILDQEIARPGGTVYQDTVSTDIQPEPVKNVGLAKDDQETKSLIEFADFSSPEWSRNSRELESILATTSGIRHQVTFFSVLPYGQKAAEGGECALKEGRFWEYYDAIRDDQTNLTLTGLKSILQRAGIDGRGCLINGDMEQEVKNDAFITQSYGVTTAPAYWFNNQLYQVDNALSDLKKTLADL